MIAADFVTISPSIVDELTDFMLQIVTAGNSVGISSTIEVLIKDGYDKYCSIDLYIETEPAVTQVIKQRIQMIFNIV